jgi:Mrp family chromosome partitioning ATPase
MPPGTGDVPLTVLQSLPVAGVVIVTSPQDLVSLIVEKAVRMADMMNVPILGLVENMSEFKCPDCGKQLSVFGKSHAKELAEKFSIPNVATLPIDPDYAARIDAGLAEHIELEELSDIV